MSPGVLGVLRSCYATELFTQVCSPQIGSPHQVEVWVSPESNLLSHEFY